MIEQGREAALQLLTQHPQVTAIFAYNDLLAVGAIQACKKLGRRVPEDCAIVGFDDIQQAALVTPALTAVHVDKYELGRQAATRLADADDHSFLNAWPPDKLPPVTLGPWVAVEYKTDEIMLLRRNPCYWKVDEAGNQLPYLDEVVFEKGTSGVGRTLGTLAGSLDHFAGEDSTDSWDRKLGRADPCRTFLSGRRSFASGREKNWMSEHAQTHVALKISEV